MERIISAAIWYKEFPIFNNNTKFRNPINITEGAVFCGYRHNTIIALVNDLTNKRQFELGEYTQGFLTTENRFVDRAEAAKIHKKNGGKTQYDKDELFSEDVY